MSYIVYKDSIPTPIFFIHIPKTAGGSILDILMNNFSYDIITNNRTVYKNYHSTLNDVDQFVCPLSPPYIFTIVRNPWNRAISWFWFRKEVLRRGLGAIRAGKKLEKVVFDYDLLYNEYMIMGEGFEKWLFKYYDQPWDHTWFKLSTNQNEWIKSKNYKVDKIIKFENLQQEFNEIKYFSNFKLPNKNEGIIKDKELYKTFYSDTTRNFIKKLYEEDIDTFKYVF